MSEKMCVLSSTTFRLSLFIVLESIARPLDACLVFILLCRLLYKCVNKLNSNDVCISNSKKIPKSHFSRSARAL